MTLTGTSLRCSLSAQGENLDPIGSAGCYEGYVLVTCPMPWPSDVAEVPGLEPVITAAARRGMRVQLLAPKPDGLAHVLIYHRPATGHGFSGYARREVIVDTPSEAHRVATDLLDNLDILPVDDSAEEIRDVLVCTHGRRDRCCGSFGTVLFGELAKRQWPSSVRFWRTSHSGGHRFAPTVLILPEATAWAFVDLDALSRIVARHDPPGDLLGHYRGCAGLGSPQAQVLERAAISEVGWALLDASRSTTDLDGRRHRLTATWPGQAATWEGSVDIVHRVTLPPCGGDASAGNGKPTPEWALDDLSRSD